MKRLTLGIVLGTLIVLATALAPFLTRFDPIKPDYRARYAPPGEGHVLGTDGLGRDVLSRSLAGGRVSLSIALSATAISLAIGLGFGTMAVGIGGLLDTVLARAFDALLAFPGFLLVLLVVTILGGGADRTVVALGTAGAPLYFRLVRSYARKELLSDYASAGYALGASRARLLYRHALPNFVGALLVQAASTAATFLLVEASLSYLGLGVALPTPSWGNVLQDARSYLTRQPWAAMGPGIFLAAASLSFQFVSDGLRDRFDRRA